MQCVLLPKHVWPAMQLFCRLSATACDALREDGKEQAERRIAENNLAADDDFAREGRRPYITKTQCRIGDDREVIGREPGVCAVLVIEDLRKNRYSLANGTTAAFSAAGRHPTIYGWPILM